MFYFFLFVRKTNVNICPSNFRLFAWRTSIILCTSVYFLPPMWRFVKSDVIRTRSKKLTPRTTNSCILPELSTKNIRTLFPYCADILSIAAPSPWLNLHPDFRQPQSNLYHSKFYDQIFDREIKKIYYKTSSFGNRSHPV